MALSKKNVALLASIVAAMAVADTPYAMLTEDEIKGLTKEGFVETNADIRDGDKIAVRATEAGMAAHAANQPQEGNNTNMTDTPVSPAPSAFAIDDNVPIPAVRGGRGSNVYPFDGLNVGQSFHVAATTDKPNPTKTLASTVSSATARYAEPTGQTENVVIPVYQTGADGKRVKGADGKLVKTGERTEARPVMRKTRKFIVVSVDATDPRGKGARVFRTA